MNQKSKSIGSPSAHFDLKSTSYRSKNDFLSTLTRGFDVKIQSVPTQFSSVDLSKSYSIMSTLRQSTEKQPYIASGCAVSGLANQK
jgi:hypothetical protein